MIEYENEKEGRGKNGKVFWLKKISWKKGKSFL
jgi:hypothetical protein